MQVALFAGTRPEAIKLAPLVQALRKDAVFDATLIASGQHDSLLYQALNDFSLTPDFDLKVMRPRQSLAELSARLFAGIDGVLEEVRPDWVLVQGDTATAQVAAHCAFYRGIPVGHVEAGLRSHDLSAPFPEELNRRILTLLAELHFAPTRQAAANLRAEGVPPERIRVTGNSGIDALLQVAAAVRCSPPALPAGLSTFLERYPGLVLITSHRREALGQRLPALCLALDRLARQHPQVGFVFCLHPNPAVRQTIHDRLKGAGNVLLSEPLSYRPFVYVMQHAQLLITDSGGLQEEAPSLGVPLLVTRAVTERPEGLATGCAELLPLEPEDIVFRVRQHLAAPLPRGEQRAFPNPYGDGRASLRILAALRQESSRGRPAA
ncbi:non-hydrolyzing UDP-N-acetylglucosamine 2-epimerase [Aquibaculum arenosum]|uniref:UDP-N-acetylglucosamine 2-epimerase (non-hydrolyzing) n=1 Tax=Aquibaculum arenosum TaxID=3032591 RepID=A0ABT5YP76_9PROT|nr:UDP-N-acetylglucosamine 2-epimerase (non-hydrolyzing) [Fodinicurvata sp. CAU 1616]MDF2096689.1 UDP-N-acetylglucosamine 2-epimerase (non-hydrolyzing) [Fodinicurvata sp. CAU 1616]